MKYFKIHLSYFLNIHNLIIIGLLVMTGVIFSILPALENQSTFNEIEIISNLIMFTKLILLNLNNYLIGSFFSQDTDNYHLIIKDFKKHQVKVYLEKFMVVYLYLFLITFSLFFFSSIINKLINSNFEVSNVIFKLYLDIFLLELIYGTLAVLMVRLFNNTVSCFIPSLLFVVGELINDSKKNLFINLYQILIPSIDESNVLLNENNILSLITLFGLYFVMAILVILNLKKA